LKHCVAYEDGECAFVGGDLFWCWREYVGCYFGGELVGVVELFLFVEEV